MQVFVPADIVAGLSDRVALMRLDMLTQANGFASQTHTDYVDTAGHLLRKFELRVDTTMSENRGQELTGKAMLCMYDWFSEYSDPTALEIERVFIWRDEPGVEHLTYSGYTEEAKAFLITINSEIPDYVEI